MKKVIVLIVFIFLISGCTIDYNITISSDSINEEIVFNNTNYTFPRAAFYDDVNYSEDNNTDYIPGIEYYKVTKENNNSIFSYNFKPNDYKRSYAVNSCVNSLNIVENNKEYTINPTSYFSCFDTYDNLDVINVNIKVSNEYKVTYNNADSIKDGVYSWIINEKNYTKRKIGFKYIKKVDLEKQNNQENGEEKNFFEENFGLVALGIFVFLGLLIFVLVRLKSQK